MIIPGLTGGINSSYVRYAMLSGIQNGFRTVIYTNRGLDDTRMITSQYHGAHSATDIRMALEHIQ